jgi:hypothetical protein
MMLAIVLAAPNAAHAGMGEVIDAIIGLTGPQMIGVPIDCEVNLQTRARACFIAGFAPRGLPPNYAEDRRLWVVIGGGAYTSTNKDSEMREFSWGDAHMLAFEPTVNVRSYVRPSTDDTSFAVEHGVGASALYLFGDFDSFVKGGIKIRPVGVVWRNINGRRFNFGLAYNLRFFPNAFTPAEFGRPGPTTHGGREFAHGFTLTLAWY